MLALLEAARALAPRIAALGDVIEQERRLPGELVQALAGADLWHMVLPAYLGGAETDLATTAQVIEAIARADGSTGWCLCQGAVSAVVAARMDRGAAARIWGDPRAVVAVGPGGGTAVEVEGGYRLTGRWSFASGGHHATWLGGRYVTILAPDGTPRRGPDGRPLQRTFMFPAEAAEFTDVWHVSGLRGTGSDNYSVGDLFVPESQVLYPFGRRDPEATGPLYVFSESSIYGVGFAAVALGIARATIDAFVELAQTKQPTLGATLLREQSVVQLRVGKVEAELRAAHAFLHQSIANAWGSACRGGAIPPDERVLLRLASTHAIHAAADAVTAIYRMAGASAIFAGGPFERRFRDINAVTQQVQAHETHFETAGRFFLGADTGQAGYL